MKVRDLKPGTPFTVDGAGSLSGSKVTYIRINDLGDSYRDNALVTKLWSTTWIHGDREVTWSGPPIESD